METVLKTHDLNIGYAPARRSRIVVSRDLNLSLRRGEVVCLLGPNGAGKSTLLRTLAGMQKPLTGGVMLMGQDVHRAQAQELAKYLSVVLTERVNPGMLTGYALAALGRHPYTDWAGNLSNHDEAMVKWALEAVGALDLAGKPVAEMSDGQRQKIMIARALAQDPAVMILDEPTAFLDLPRRAEMMRLLKQLAREANRAILLSSHDLDLAMRTADRVWLMPVNGPMQVGGPEDLVLSGAFEQVFATEGVTFDRTTGTFLIAPEREQSVLVTGEGLRCLWTKRALERGGFRVASNGDSGLACVEVVEDVWRVEIDGQSHTVSNLAELVTTLRDRVH